MSDSRTRTTHRLNCLGCRNREAEIERLRAEREMPAMERKECPTHGPDTGVIYAERPGPLRCGHGEMAGRGCGEPLVVVRYVPETASLSAVVDHWKAEVERLREALADTLDALERTNRDPAFDYEAKKLAEETAHDALIAW